jgi:YVTN family beta-propeller protein
VRSPFARLSLLVALMLAPLAAEAATPSDLVVVNQPFRTVQVIDGRTGRVLSTNAMGADPHEVEVSPDGAYAVAPIYGDGAVGRAGSDGRTLEIIDLRGGAKRVVDLGQPVRPHDAKFGPDGLLYVTGELIEAVLVVDPKSWRVIARIPTGRPQTHSLVISPDGARAYTANVASGSVSVLDLVGRKLLAVVNAGEAVQRVSLSPDGRRVYTHDQRSPRVIAIDADTLRVADRFELPGLPYASTATPDGRTLLVAGRPERPGTPQRSPALYFLDLQTRAVVTVETVAWPRVILLEADGRTGWTNLGAGHLLRIDVPARSVTRLVALERGLDGMALRPRR